MAKHLLIKYGVMNWGQELLNRSNKGHRIQAMRKESWMEVRGSHMDPGCLSMGKLHSTKQAVNLGNSVPISMPGKVPRRSVFRCLFRRGATGTGSNCCLFFLGNGTTFMFALFNFCCLLRIGGVGSLTELFSFCCFLWRGKGTGMWLLLSEIHSIWFCLSD
jgi:hypothetical protein